MLQTDFVCYDPAIWDTTGKLYDAAGGETYTVLQPALLDMEPNINHCANILYLK